MKWFKRLILLVGVLTLIGVFLLRSTTKPIGFFRWQNVLKNTAAKPREQWKTRTFTVKEVLTTSTEEVDMVALLKEARKKSACKDVIKNPKSFWRSQPHGLKFTASRDAARMATAFRCGVLDEDFLRSPPHGPFYKFEKMYLSQPPATNLTGLSSLHHTVVSLAKPVVKVGEVVTVIVETKDAEGNQKTLGGDEIRVWLVDIMERNVITASVTDMDNGTYVATSALQWPGTFKVKVAIAYPREYLRALIHVHRVFKHTRLFVGHFANDKADETTPCYHNRVLPGGYTDFCNLTAINGSPWFCGRPVKNELTCAHFKGGHNGPFKRTEILPLTDTEFQLIHTPYKTHSTHLVKESLHLTVAASDNRQYPLPCAGNTPCPLCNELPARDTWNTAQPTGFLYQGVWYPGNCKLYYFTPQQCFKDTQWTLLGDSNLRSHYYTFKAQAQAMDVVKALTERWHKPLSCTNPSLNFVMTWDPHSQPFLSGPILAELGSLVPSTAVLDGLSSEGRHIIILNHFYHISGSHFSSIHAKLLAVKDALVRLFRRNTSSIALMHSPHISWKGWGEHFGAGDMLGRHLIQLQHEIFSTPALRDRIIYLPMWDITQAVENIEFHPDEFPITTILTQHYLCGRRLEFEAFTE